MVTFYNSKAEPKKVFGDDTPEYLRFMDTMEKELLGAMLGMRIINNFWDTTVDAQHWTQLDGMACHVKVKTHQKAIIEVEEIGSSFTYVWDEVGASDNGISLPANMTQSFDGLVVREMKARCNYNLIDVRLKHAAMTYELDQRTDTPIVPREPEMICMPHIHDMKLTDIKLVNTFDLTRMVARLNLMLDKKPFAVVTVHDELKAHPNNMNEVRYNYKEIMAEIAACPALTRVLGSMQECDLFEKLSYDLPQLIRESEYALS